MTECVGVICGAIARSANDSDNQKVFENDWNVFVVWTMKQVVTELSGGKKRTELVHFTWTID